MRNPFLILLTVAVVIGEGIGSVFVFLFDSEVEQEQAEFVDQRTLPTPSGITFSQSSETRLANQTRSEGARVVSTQVIESETVAGAAPSGAAGGGFGGGAFRQALEDNPEIAELIEKAQAGELSPEEQQQMRTLIQEAIADAGFAPPVGAAGGGGFGAPVTGTIASIEGSTVMLDPFDDSETDTRITVATDTSITIVRAIGVEDLNEGDSVSAFARRDEEGRNAAVAISVAPEGSVGGLGMIGAAIGGAEGATQVRGEIATVEDGVVTVDTSQGPLRVAVVEDTTIVTIDSGSVADLSDGMALVAIGLADTQGEIEARTIFAGPEHLLNEADGSGLRGFTGGGGRDRGLRPGQ